MIGFAVMIYTFESYWRKMISGIRAIYERAGENGALLCPPHPDYGGSMFDVRLERISRKLVMNRISTLRFDYRSVETALKDARICFDWLKREHDRVAVIGYSFGSVIASNICGDALVLISPLRRIDGFELGDCETPKLLVIAKRDQIVSLRESLEIARTLSEPKEIAILDTDHLYSGKFDILAEKVSEFVVRLMKS